MADLPKRSYFPSGLVYGVEQRESRLNLADGREYMLGRSYAAASRLDFQHYLWKDSLLFNLHPSVPILKDARTADVAT